ncbi:hypothetical protein ACKVMT_16600 [Halobacteriales archaeon Cl-PHB]
MADRRQYTGTRTLQLLWSAGVVVGTLGYAVMAAAPLTEVLARPVVLVGASGAWLLGLFVLAWRDRRHWRKLVAHSDFDQGSGPSTADLQRIVKGHSVTVATTVPALLGQTHTEIRAGVEGVDASFTIRLEHRGDEDASDEGLETGNPALDSQYVIEGSAKNVKLLLSTDVQSALMDVETPGECLVTGDHVVYDVPFTRLSAGELARNAEAVAVLAERLEEIGRGAVSPTATGDD